MRRRRTPLSVTRARTWRRPLPPTRVVLVPAPIPLPTGARSRSGPVPPERTAAHRFTVGTTAR